MVRTWDERMNELDLQDQKQVILAQQALQRVSAQADPKAVFDALRPCMPIVGGLVGTFVPGRLDSIASHAAGLPSAVIENWFDAPCEQLMMMMTPILTASAGQLLSDSQVMTGALRENIELLELMPKLGLGESAGYMVSDPLSSPRRLTFLTFALDEYGFFTPRDHMLLSLLRPDIHAALERLRLPFVPSQSLIAQVLENRQWGFVLVSQKDGRCMEMNWRARDQVARYHASARVEPGRFVVSSFAMRAVFETRSKDRWLIPHIDGIGDLEVSVHDLKKEDHAIAEDAWLVMMDENAYAKQIGMFAKCGLTPREEEIAVLLVETSMYYRQIAARLGTSVDTVRTQVNSIYRKCKVTSRSELALTLKKSRLS